MYQLNYVRPVAHHDIYISNLHVLFEYIANLFGSTKDEIKQHFQKSLTDYLVATNQLTTKTVNTNAKYYKMVVVKNFEYNQDLLKFFNSFIKLMDYKHMPNPHHDLHIPINHSPVCFVLAMLAYLYGNEDIKIINQTIPKNLMLNFNPYSVL